MAGTRKSVRRRSPKRKSPKRSVKRRSSKRKSTKRRSTKRKSPKRSAKKRSPKTPSVSASTLFEGQRRKGRDGSMYIVRLKADGSPYWKKCGPKADGGSECRFIGPMRKPVGY